MGLFQILDCNGDLGTCCTDYALVGVLNIAKYVFGLIQFVIPIILIIAGTIQFVQLTINPELKDGLRRVLNKVIAAVIIFILPTLIDAILGVAPGDFSVAACWQQATAVSAETAFSSGNYSHTPDEQNAVWIDPISFSTVSNMGAPPNSGSASTMQEAIVEYAEQFIGEEYLWAGSWDGEIPYTPTDCSGFVTGVFRHFGINLPRGLNMFGYDTSLYDVVDASDIQPADVIMYNGHVGILTGNGNEFIHAKGSAYGVVKDPDYTVSSKEILGILRIKGVK